MLDLDPYATLGVSVDATERQIKRAYRLRAKELHPDVQPHGSDEANGSGPSAASHQPDSGGPGVSSQPGYSMLFLNLAYEMLLDPVARRRYDAAHPRVEEGPVRRPQRLRDIAVGVVCCVLGISLLVAAVVLPFWVMWNVFPPGWKSPTPAGVLGSLAGAAYVAVQLVAPFYAMRVALLGLGRFLRAVERA